jgi:hypothetical protein
MLKYAFKQCSVCGDLLLQNAQFSSQRNFLTNVGGASAHHRCLGQISLAAVPSLRPDAENGLAQSMK